MNYILNSLEEIRKVYTPDIEYLNTPVDWIPFTFCGIEKTILESMRFYQYYYHGDDHEKEDLSLKDFNFKNKSHKYYGLNYDYLLKNIDLEIFKTELDKSITKEENYFIFKIKEELGKNNNIEFEMNLNDYINSLYSSKKALDIIVENTNDFDRILIEKYIISYEKVFNALKFTYSNFVNNKTMFSFKFSRADYYATDEVLRESSKNANESDLIANETFVKTETNNPFTKEELKLILDNNSKDDFINKFYANETDLFKQGYFKEGKWDKSKKSLIVFCKVIAESSYIQKRYSGKKLLPIFKFFEKRYDIKLGDQRKPCNHKLIIIDENDFADFKYK